MDDTNSLIEQRKAKLAALRAKGIDPSAPPTFFGRIAGLRASHPRYNQQAHQAPFSDGQSLIWIKQHGFPDSRSDRAAVRLRHDQEVVASRKHTGSGCLLMSLNAMLLARIEATSLLHHRALPQDERS